jgi:hypothetical protein
LSGIFSAWPQIVQGPRGGGLGIHGNVTIIDRRGLIRRSCECYGVSKKEFDSLLGDRARRKVRSGRM